MAEFTTALRAEGVPAIAGYIPVTMQRNPVFQNHGFFAGRWPIKEFGLTDMDYTEHVTPEADRILESAVRIQIHESMNETYVEQMAEAVRKVAAHYKA